MTGVQTSALPIWPDYAPRNWRGTHPNYSPIWTQLHFTHTPDANLRLVVRIYEAEDHFTRVVTIPDIRMWAMPQWIGVRD